MTRNSHALEFLFHPRAVAVAGASLGASGGWGGGNMFIGALRAMGYRGGIYPVNPRATEGSLIDELPVYPRLRDIPEPVDYVISSVPATAVLELMDDAAAKGVRAIHFFTAGFRETGDAARADLERQVLRRAQEAGIRLIGPNCMGIYSPRTGLSFNPMFPREAGAIGVVSQSGLNAQEIVNFGATRGLRFSKVISFGNALDLNEADFLEYFAADPETELVAVYLEGVQKGPRMFHALRSLAQRKPVVLLKGGATEAGSRAAASHTGSLAGAARVWQALARQSNAIAVDSIEEVCDQLVALQALPQGLSGNRAAIIGSGGGTSVLAADACAREGIDVPALPGDVQERLLEFTPLAGNSVRNPLDTFAITDRDNFVRTVRIVGEAENIDFILLHTHAGWGFRQMTPGEALEQTIAGILASREATTKPVLVVLREPMSAEQAEPWMQLRTRCSAEGVPVFNGIERAARALSRVVEWHEQRGELASQAG